MVVLHQQPGAPSSPARRPDRLAFYMGYCRHRRKDRVSLGKRGCAATCSASRAGACRLRRRRKQGGVECFGLGRLRPFRWNRREPGASGDTRYRSSGGAPRRRSAVGAASLSHRVSARKRSPNLCKNDIVVFLERSRSALPMKLLSAATALQLAGYKPARVVGERHLDAAQAQRMSCPDCGAHGLRYNSYQRPSGSAHRGLAWCPECLTTVEL
jgi:hypothetical protein